VETEVVPGWRIPESWAVNTRLVFPPQLLAAVLIVTPRKDEKTSQRVKEGHL